MKSKNKLIVYKEHIIPLNIITKKLLELPINPSIAQIKTILNKNVKYATITKDEDKICHPNIMIQVINYIIIALLVIKKLM